MGKEREDVGVRALDGLPWPCVGRSRIPPGVSLLLSLRLVPALDQRGDVIEQSAGS